MLYLLYDVCLQNSLITYKIYLKRSHSETPTLAFVLPATPDWLSHILNISAHTMYTFYLIVQSIVLSVGPSGDSIPGQTDRGLGASGG